MKRLISALLLTLVLGSTPGFSDSWDANSNPKNFQFQDENFETNFDRLRLSGRADSKDGHTPYSDTYWPATQGGIAVRYLDPSRESAFTYSMPSLDQLKRMSTDQITRLSPAEKFDIYRQRYDYPLVARVRRIYSPNNPSWWGICHGWTPGAANFPEPNAVNAINPDGIAIQFGSSDVKAIISFYYAWEAAQFNDDGTPNYGWDNDGKYWQKDPAMVYFIYRGVGNRNEGGSQRQGRKDLNPGSFHIILSNLIGRYNRSFNADVDATDQVWNQPVYGYSSEVVKYKRGRVLIKTVFDFIVESSPSFNTHGRAGQIHDSKTLQYWLDLDGAGNIIGGEWVKNTIFGRKTESLDFIWRASRVPFIGAFAPLNELYKTNATKVTSYAMAPGYTPGLIDISASDEAGLIDQTSVLGAPAAE